MDAVTTGTNRNLKSTFKKKKIVKIISVFLAVAVLASGTYYFVHAKNSKAASADAQRTAVVTRGQIVDSITGSAPIEASNRSELSPKATATLQQIKCKEGDQVKAGDVLFVLDNTDALLNIENTKNNIAQMQLTLDNEAESINGLQVKAPFSGQVTNINVREGDAVNKGGALFTITDMDSLVVTLPFSGDSVKNVLIGQNADVYLQDLMLSVDGKVTYKSSKPYTSASGNKLYNVEITMKNPGALKEGMKATAEITAGGTKLESIESGTLSYANSKVVKSNAGGTIKSMNLRENEYVNAGDILAEMENDDLMLSVKSDNIKMENLKSQLGIQQKQLEYYSITAPFDGTITSMGKANEGDTVKQGEVLAVVSDMGHLEFSVDIDELDIAKVSVGQKVNITAEALEETADTPLTGTVSKIAMEGSSSNGVTTYPVTVTVNDASAGKLKTGMNIDADIIIKEKQDTLMVPLEAVTKLGNRSFVYVVSEDGLNGASGQFGQNGTGRGGANSSNGMAGWNGSNGAAGWNNSAGSGNSSGSSGSSGTRSFNRGQRRNNTSGSVIQGQRPNRQWASGSTSAGAIAGNTSAGAIAGNTSAGAIGGNFARAAQRAAGNSYYANAIPVPVETGISNGTYIEILSGLSEGQEIVLPKLDSSPASSQRNQGGLFGGFNLGGNRMAGGGFTGNGGNAGGGNANSGNNRAARNN